MTDTSTALRECLLILAELKEECGLDLQLGKCKLYIKGTSLADARALVRSVINAEPGWSSISEKLQGTRTSSKNVIQVDGITCVGVRAYRLARLRQGVRQGSNISHGRRC